MCVKVTVCTPWWHLGKRMHKYSSCFNRSMLFPMCVKVTACTPCVALKLGYIYICYELHLELDVFIKLWCLLNHLALKVKVWGYLDWGRPYHGLECPTGE